MERLLYTPVEAARVLGIGRSKGSMSCWAPGSERWCASAPAAGFRRPLCWSSLTGCRRRRRRITQPASDGRRCQSFGRDALGPV